jgi:hypothetical protein
MPVQFVKNVGQFPDGVRFAAFSGDAAVLFGNREIVFRFVKPVPRREPAQGHERFIPSLDEEPPTATVRMRLVGANSEAAPIADGRLPATSSFFVGDEPARWRTGVPHFSRVRYEGIYPGIDLVFHDSNAGLEYDFILAAGADPGAIDIELEGVETLQLGPEGDLRWQASTGAVRQHRPHAFQESGGQREVVPSGYVLAGANRLSFRLGSYDRRRPLVIDPALTFYGHAVHGGSGVVVDSHGDVSVGGYGASPSGSTDAFVTKFTASGDLVSTSYFGGSQADFAFDLGIDSQDNLYIVGTTRSLDLPQRQCVLGRCERGGYVMKVDTAGQVVYSATLASVDYVAAVAVDGDGSTVIAGDTRSLSLPLVNPFQPARGRPGVVCLPEDAVTCQDAFVARFGPAGDAVYSSYLGGARFDAARGVALDSAGNEYVVGITQSGDFRRDVGPIPVQAALRGFTDAYVVQISPAGQYLYCTYLGGSSSDYGRGIGVTPGGEISVAGETTSVDFPLRNAIPEARGNDPFGLQDAFAAKIIVGRSELVFSTYLGGDSSDYAQGAAVDSAGNTFVTGETRSTDFFPVSPLRAPPTDEETHPFAVKLDPSGQPRYSTYLSSDRGGGFDVVPAPGGAAYFTGWVSAADGDAFLARIADDTQTSVIEILNSTTRWKPQRDTAKNIDVVFSGPKDLQDPNVFTSVKLEVKDPTGAALAGTAVSTVTAVDLTTDPAKWKMTWSGPWITTNQGNASYLPRGNYKVKVIATRKDGSTVASADTDANSTVSLVEVMKVELCVDDAAECTPLSDDNPAVSASPGQDPPQGRLGGGKRIFAEALTPTGPILNQVKVRATIDPKIQPDPSRAADALMVPVYFRSFDVDDPASCPSGATDPNLCLPDLDKDQGSMVADNRSSPGQGNVLTPIFDVAPGTTTASTFFQTSSYPGDNYRVVATTSQEWRDTLSAVQPSTTGALDVPEDGKDGLSDMLTVWRTLHVEIDSMGPVSQEPAAPERNFIQGTITAIGDVRHVQGVGRRPTKAALLPETTSPPLDLSDGSRDLSGEDDAFGFGRFEDGVLYVGVGADRVLVEQLTGNASDFVQKLRGMTIPFTLVDAGGGNPLTGHILEWDTTTRAFTLNAVVGRPIYDGGRITVAGVTWTIRSARGLNVAVVEDRNLPFKLIDDDDGVTPFPISTDLMRPTDDSATNPYAQAYIRPQFDVASPKQAPFNRNISTVEGDETREMREQLALGRDSALSTPGYWVMYAQGAFQGDETEDLDPRSEIGSPSGQTVTVVGRPDADDRYGSLIYLETIRDSVRRDTSQVDRVATECVAATLPHELGHQFGLDDWRLGEPDSLMGPGGCLLAPRYFVGSQLALIRSKGATQ